LRELQYMFTHEIDANIVLHNMFIEIINTTDDFKIQLTSSEECSEDQINSILKEMAQKPKSVAFRLPPNKQLTHAIPRQIAEKRAIAIYDHETYFCVARDDEILDCLLIEMGCNEIETIDFKKGELDLNFLGFAHAGHHPNLQEVKVNQSNTSNKCTFVWRGRKKVNASDLIESYKRKCSKVQIVFKSVSGELTTDWTNLAIEFMFKSRSRLKQGYLQQFDKLRHDKGLDRARYCALEHSGNQIWLYSPEDDDCVTRLKCDIEASVTRLPVPKGLLEFPAMMDLLRTHHLNCVIKKDTIICTQDLNVDIVTILSDFPNSASTKPSTQAKPDGNDIQCSELKSGNKRLSNGKSGFLLFSLSLQTMLPCDLFFSQIYLITTVGV